MVWLGEIAYPIGALLHSHPSPLRAVVVLAGAALFVAVCAWNVWTNVYRMMTRVEERGGAQSWIALGILTALALVLTIGDRSACASRASCTITWATVSP